MGCGASTEQQPSVEQQPAAGKSQQNGETKVLTLGNKNAETVVKPSPTKPVQQPAGAGKAQQSQSTKFSSNAKVMQGQHKVKGTDGNKSITIKYDNCMGCSSCSRMCSAIQQFHVLQPGPLKQPPFIMPASGDMSPNTETSRVKFADTECVGCGKCSTSCSFNALTPTSGWEVVENAMLAGKIMVAVLAPATRVGLAESMGMGFGSTAEAQLIQHLRDMGFKYVFDKLWGADLCTQEDAEEVLEFKANNKGTCFTSCCPAWVNLVEQRYPEMLKQLSTARSPHGITCAAIKKFWVKEAKLKLKDIFVVGFMPCSAKKMEAARKQLQTEGMQDCDVCITTRELAEHFQAQDFKFTVEEEKKLSKTVVCDAPFDKFSGSAYIFGKASGVTESVARYIYAHHNVPFSKESWQTEVIWEAADNIQTIEEIKFQVAGINYTCCYAHGGAAAQEVIELVKMGQLKADCVEVMVCPQGCQNGSGQPKQPKVHMICKRGEALEAHDHQSQFKCASENRNMQRFVQKHAPTKDEVRKAFHTTFENREISGAIKIGTGGRKRSNNSRIIPRDSNYSIEFDFTMCVGCGACANYCTNVQELKILSQVIARQPPHLNCFNGDNAQNTEFTRVQLVDTNCTGCGGCSLVCPNNVIRPRSYWHEVLHAKDEGKILVAVLAPATRVGISEAMGMEPGQSAEAQLIKGLRDVGFKYVFDNQWGADACTIEDTKEMLHFKEQGKGPCFTSCCPAWVNLVEMRHPELLPQLSNARSPHGITCSIIKKFWAKENNIPLDKLVVVGIMPCTAKKSEAKRPQLMTDGVPDCDVSLTTKEIVKVFQHKKITFTQTNEEQLIKQGVKCDPPFQKCSGSAYIFGKSAGVTESVLRCLSSMKDTKFDPSKLSIEQIFEKEAGGLKQTIRIAKYECAGVTYQAAIANGGAAIQKVVDLLQTKELKGINIIECMVCPMGCSNGSGQPRQIRKPLIARRIDALDVLDKQQGFASALENKELLDYINTRMPSDKEKEDGMHTEYRKFTHK